MRYVQHVLQPGETVLHESRLHWLIYWRALLMLILALGVAAVYLLRVDPMVQKVALGVSLFCLAVSILATIGAGIRRRSTELAVTNQRIIYKSGAFSRHTMEMNRSKVESVDVDQSVLGRIFGYGTLLIRGTGGSLEPIANIQDPLAFRSRITTG